jgi:peptidoglycan/LPS O-acetylase OafA/YrhL
MDTIDSHQAEGAGQRTPFVRLDSLTALRYFAAALIVVLHWRAEFQAPLIRPLTHGFTITMEFFFILSGFVLAWSARPGDSRKDFYRRRVARLYPNHLLIWVIFLAFLAFQGEAAGWLGSVLGAPLLQAWVPSRAVFYAGNSVMWAASVEVFLYAVFPFILPVLAAVKPERRKLLMALGVVALIAYAIGHMIVAPDDLYWIYIFPPLRLVEFALGILLAWEVRDGRWFRLSTQTVVVVVAIAYLVWMFVPDANAGPRRGMPERLWPFAVVPFLVLIGYAATMDLEKRPTFLRWKPLVTLGAWSYALYVVHALVLRVVSTYVDVSGLVPSMLFGGLMVVSITVIAGVIHRFWERPLERRFRRSRVPRVTAEDAITGREQP